MRALLAGGADPSMTIPDGTTALMAAAGLKEPNAQRRRPPGLGLDRWRQASRRIANVPTPSPWPCFTGDIDGTNRNGDTALHAAAAMGYDRVITMLAEKGASLNLKNNRGQTPLKAARSNTAELLRRLGAVE